jgi:hypothetical protein
VAGKALTHTIYAAAWGVAAAGWNRCYAFVSKILVCREANGELRIFALSCAAVILVPPFGRRNQSLAPSVSAGDTSITPMRH